MSILNCEFYCLSFDNESKKKNMEERFDKLDIECKFYSGVNCSDKRIKYSGTIFNSRQWSITYGHLDIIYDFYYNSDKNYAIICEDDIIIHKNIKEIIKNLIKDFDSMELDILLLGYMLPYKIGNNHIYSNYRIKNEIFSNSFFTYHEYPEYHSGTQMYMISKKYAKFILENYYNNFLILMKKQFILDKLFIKQGNRALIYPMIAIENNNQEDNYHILCHKIHYNDWYI
jgi:hypothetical protein